MRGKHSAVPICQLKRYQSRDGDGDIELAEGLL
jgi:hypothetical protein